MAPAEKAPERGARLRAVGGDAGTVPPAAAAPAARLRADRPRSRVVSVLALALVLVTALLVWQSLRAGALAGEVSVLNEELATAREEIRVHEQRMSLVRRHVDDLSDRIGALRTLVTDE